MIFTQKTDLWLIGSNLFVAFSLVWNAVCISHPQYCAVIQGDEKYQEILCYGNDKGSSMWTESNAGWIKKKRKKKKLPTYVVGVRLSLMTSSKGFCLFYVLPGNGNILCPSTVHWTKCQVPFLDCSTWDLLWDLFNCRTGPTQVLATQIWQGSNPRWQIKSPFKFEFNKVRLIRIYIQQLNQGSVIFRLNALKRFFAIAVFYFFWVLSVF